MPIKIRPGERLVGGPPNTHRYEAMKQDLEEAGKYLATQNYRVSASEGHMAPDYPTVLRRGLQAIHDEVVELLSAQYPLNLLSSELKLTTSPKSPAFGRSFLQRERIFTASNKKVRANLETFVKEGEPYATRTNQ